MFRATKKTKLSLEMTGKDIIMAMGEGHPGGITCCTDILKVGARVDPDDAMRGLGSILILDMLGLYGYRLYILWNDVCERNTGKMIAVLRAYQLGQLAGVTEEVINHAVDNRGAGLDLEAVVKVVQERLPAFNVDGCNATPGILNRATVGKIFIECLFSEDEDTTSAVKVEGITGTIDFHPVRVYDHKAEIEALLDELPDEYKKSGGGGSSFLNACIDKHGNHWTDLHAAMEQLFALGMAVNKVECLAPREEWKNLPGGMPYYVIN